MYVDQRIDKHANKFLGSINFIFFASRYSLIHNFRVTIFTLVLVMSSNRSKPFSGKKKKEQLQLKKQIKNQKLKNEVKEEFWDEKEVSSQINTEKKNERIK